MNVNRTRWRATLGIGTALALVLGACQSNNGSGSEGPATSTSAGAGQPSAGAALSADLLGAGATFPDPVYQEWIGAFVGDNEGVAITYEPIGSGGGVEQFTAQSTDFGGSDAFMTDDELAAAEEAWGCEVVHIPTVFGAVAVAFNLSGVDSLTLDSDTLSGIFLGEITSWSDPAIVNLNPEASLPDEQIIVAHRSDGSGTTSIFTHYLADESDAWDAQVGAREGGRVADRCRRAGQ